jgi:hypothetical protein
MEQPAAVEVLLPLSLSVGVAGAPVLVLPAVPVLVTPPPLVWPLPEVAIPRVPPPSE